MRAPAGNTFTPDADHIPIIACFSHLRWNFVFQRPQHLLTRAARDHRVVFFEEPEYECAASPQLRLTPAQANVTVAAPVLPVGIAEDEAVRMQRHLLHTLLAGLGRDRLILWYYTPMALAFSRQVEADLCVYDCMDELSAFLNPPAGLLDLEEELFQRADLVFTGGHSLYEAKRSRHGSVHVFPSSIDVSHFGQAREGRRDPPDQSPIGWPRIGFFGVIDERLDMDLVAKASRDMPDCHFVMIGPVVKIDEAMLPRAANLRWLGPKSYGELPDYLANWNAGWMPFALNEATRFISPTKTPEFLAAGLPVVSTAITDVVRTYAPGGLVTIAGPESVVSCLRTALESPRADWLSRVDAWLAGTSWQMTWDAMAGHMARALSLKGVAALRKGA